MVRRYHGKRHVTTERTSKAIKRQMIGAFAVLFLSAWIAVAGVAVEAPVVVSLGAGGAIVGIGWGVFLKARQWWEHG